MRRLLVFMVAVGLLGGCTPPPADEEAPPEQPAIRRHDGPNVVVIGVDTLRWDAMGLAGSPLVRTPNLDRLARMGVNLTNTVVPVPITAPTFATLFTGKSPRNHGVINNAYRLPDEEETLAEILRSHGYTTRGVVSGRVMGEASGLAQGFEHYDDDLFRDYAKGEPERFAPETTGLAVRWIDQYLRFRDQPPFFLFLHYIDPHLPYTPEAVDLEDVGLPKTFPGLAPNDVLGPYFSGETPSEDRQDEVARQYLAQVYRLDRALGDLFAALDRHNLWEETILVFTSDHGEALYERYGYLGHAFSLFEETLRVATVLRGPGLPGDGRVFDARVRTMDLFTTILDLVGLPERHPADVQGESLVAELQAGTLRAREAWSETFAPEGETDKQAYYRDDLKLIQPSAAGAPKGHIPGPLATEGQGIYDVSADPGESSPLAPQGREGFLREYQRTARDQPPRDQLAKPELDAERREVLQSVGYLLD